MNPTRHCMNAVLKYTIEVESENPPTILIGQNLFGGKVTALKMENIPKLVTVGWLSERYGLSRTTIIKKLESHQQGSEGKYLYDSQVALVVLSNVYKSKRGAKRVN